MKCPHHWARNGMLPTEHTNEFAGSEQFSSARFERPHHLLRVEFRIDRFECMNSNPRGFDPEFLVVEFHIA